jgi:hypothetical protein
MNDTETPEPKLLEVYAPGFGPWLKRTVKANPLVTILIAVFALCVGLLTLLHGITDQASLVYKVTSEVIIAVLIATTVGLFYELVARGNMITETTRVVKQELGPELAAIRECISHDCGLVGFGETHDYFHRDVAQHLDMVEHIGIMAIHGTRVWESPDLKKAVQQQGVSVEVLLLAPQSHFVQSRVDEDPDEYSLNVIQGQINSSSQILGDWRRKNKGIDLKLYNYPPSFWLAIVDEVLYVSVYGKGRLGQEETVYKFDHRPHSLYHFFNEHFRHVWNATD